MQPEAAVHPAFIEGLIEKLAVFAFRCSPKRKLLKSWSQKPKSTLWPPDRGRWSQEDAGIRVFRKGPNAKT
jgi:hypothetical protein